MKKKVSFKFFLPKFFSKIYFLKFLFVFCFLFFLFAADLAEAIRMPEIQYPEIPFSDIETPNQFIQKIRDGVYQPGDGLALYIRYYYSLVIILAVLAVFGSIVYAGFQYLIGRGKELPQLIAIGKDRISSGFLGLIIIFLTQFILTTINPQLSVLSFNALEPERCDCSKPKDQLSDYCKIYCQPAPPPITEDTPIYVEVPLGRMIEWVMKKSEEAEVVASTTNKIAYLLKTKTERLNNLTKNCNCSGSGTETQCSAGADCSGGVCIGEPCLDRSEIDRLRLQEIPDLIKELQLWRQKTFLAKMALQREYINLRLAEDILRDSLLTPTSYQTYIGLDKRITQKITHWSNIDITYNPLTKLKGGEDPATFYIPKKGNEELIALVENVAAPNPSPPPIESCSAGQTKPYALCDGTTCITIDSCGESACNDCGNQPPSCPAGQTRPHSVCDGIVCRSVNSCGVDACSGSGSCIAPPPSNCSIGTGLCSPANLMPPGYTWDIYKASQICDAESSGNATALNTDCLNNGSCDYSGGLFQVNLLASNYPSCLSGLRYDNTRNVWDSRYGVYVLYCQCYVLDQNSLNDCITYHGVGNAPLAYQNNILRASEKYNYHQNWCAWTTAYKCGLCP